MVSRLVFVVVVVVALGGALAWKFKSYLLSIEVDTKEDCGERRLSHDYSVLKMITEMGCSELCLLRSAIGHDGNSLACVNFDGKGGASLASQTLMEHCGWGNQVDKTRANRARHFERFLKDSAPRNGTKGSALIELHDGSTSPPQMGRYFTFLRTPILSSSAHVDQKHITLIPDADYVGSQGYASLNTQIDSISRKSPWHKKKHTVVFRGSTTGFVPSNPDLHELRRNTRIALALMSKEHNENRTSNSRWDAAISKVNFPGEEVRKAALNLGVTKPELNFEQQIAGRGIFDVDGNTNSWSACWWKLRSNSVSLKVLSPLRQWYYHKLTPWEHYIPVSSDLSDVNERVAYVLNGSNDLALKKISHAATRLIRNLSYENEVEKVRAQLESCFAHGSCAPAGSTHLNDDEISALESAFLKGLSHVLDIDSRLWALLEKSVACHAAVLK